MVALKTSDIDSFVARPDPARAVVLVFGPDAGLVSERADKIIAASVDDTSDPFSLVRLDGDTIAFDPARLVDEATTVPLFGGRRAIRVRAGARNIVPAIEALLSAPLRDCRVVIEAGDLRKSAPLRSAIEKAKTAVALPCYADDERGVARLIDDEMRAAGLTISAEAREMLLPLLGGDRRASRAELQKLAMYARGQERVDVDDVMAVVTDASALGFDTLIDAAFTGDVAEVEREFQKAMIAGTSPIAIVGVALRQVSQLHVMRLEVESGTSASSLVERPQYGIHFRRKPIIGKALQTWTSARLAKVMAMLGQTSLDARVQSALSETLVQRAMTMIARSAAQRG